AQRVGGFDAAKHAVRTNQGRRLMNEMRQLVADIQSDERATLAERLRQSRRSAQVTTATNLAGALMGVGLVALAFGLFRREISHRQRADDALRQLAAIVESSDDAIVSKTTDGTIVSWNAGAARVYGYRAEEAIGRPISILSPPDTVDDIQSVLDRVCQAGHIQHLETRRIRKDGRLIDVSLSISPIKDESGRVVGASTITRDITEQKLLQREVLEIAAREQQRIGQDLHDGTGQELTGLAMLAERLVGELSSQRLPQAEPAERIVEGLEQALEHVRALSKGLVPVELDAEGLMAALSDLAMRTSQLHQILCTFECVKPVRILDNQTSTHLYRLSQEAVTNALKHGQATVITLRLTDDAGGIRLVVRDNGLGIGKELPESGGTGLRIMHYRTSLIGAKLQIRAAVPRGTEVVCTLPHAREPEANGRESGTPHPPEPKRAMVS
ncbi:MAG: PAS domain S-box protein, partial [Planctomycetaceae bacterium]|nr:PAS domain S-box protein [Planctomycetaceae bacterium]